METIDPATEMPIVTGYAQCSEGLMGEYDRGYSEVTFSRLAALVGAREAIIHKEFHLSSCDPKLVGASAVNKLGRTNYDVADQLSNMGMEAIHPKAAKTLRQAKVPLRVANAFEPDDPGTLIDDRAAETPAVEIVTGLDIVTLEVFEQDMVGVKGYDATILESLKRHRVRIVSKVSNANTITHYLDTSLKTMRRVEKDIAQAFPAAEIITRTLSMASVIGRDMAGLSVLSRGLVALSDAGLTAVGASQGPRNVDVQFIVDRSTLKLSNPGLAWRIHRKRPASPSLCSLDQQSNGRFGKEPEPNGAAGEHQYQPAHSRRQMVGSQLPLVHHARLFSWRQLWP